MKQFANAAIVTSLLTISSQSLAIDPVPKAEHNLPTLAQESQHSVAAKRVSALFSRAHYRDIELNDALSEQMYDRFLRSLDINKQIFTASDIKKLSKYALTLDNSLVDGNLTGVYDIYALSLQRRTERYEYALSLLEKPFDFAQKGDKFYFNREKADWASTEDELNELWRQRVKYDALNLKMAGKDSDEIKELLTKRYEQAIKRLTQTNSEDVFQIFMNVFANTVEPHTRYLSPRNAERFRVEMDLSFEGIGAVLQSQDDFTVIQSVVPGGPAELSKQIKPEDKIVGVAQGEEEFVDIVGWRLDEVVELIKGPQGSEVRLQVVKGASADSTPSIVSLTRDEIKLEDREAKSEVYEPTDGPNVGKKLGVITIPSFYNNLHQDVIREINKLKESQVAGIIIDLRGNGGGSLTETTLLSGLFIDQGPVVQVRDGAGRISVNRDTDGKTYYDGPLTILVDRYSASASEIFAAAMQDYNRALIVGEQTFGKGTVQQHRGLGRIYDVYENPLGSVQFTVAKFYRIDGGSTQHKGIIPDVSYPSPIDPAEWGESQEENALPWDSIKGATYTTFENADSEVKLVNQKHLDRIKSNPEFNYLLHDIEEYKREKDKMYISLVEEERVSEKKENEAKGLKRANERLARMGKEPIENLDDLPEELQELDPFLDETASITFDLIETNKYAINRR